MLGVTRHLRVGLVFLALLLLSFMPLRAAADVSTVDSHAIVEKPKIIITEIQTNGGLAAQEFIELYNTSDEAINLSPGVSTTGSSMSQWRLQFYPSGVLKDGAPIWPPTVLPYVFSLKGVIQPHGYFLVASTDHKQLDIEVPADQVYSKSNPMTDAGGAVELIEVPDAKTADQTIVHDQALWIDSKVARAEGVLSAPPKFGSLQREPNDDGTYTNEDGSLQGFISDPDITPLTEWKAPVTEVTVDTGNIDPGTVAEPVDGTGGGTPMTQADNTGPLLPYLTELLPNPASPLKDETDEYIELFNPNAAAFNLKGYTVEVGTATLHDFTVSEDLLIPAESYLVLYSKDTRLSLANSGGQARLLDPHDAKLSETLPYTAADEGAVWSFSDDTWQWSLSATPGLPNVITTPVTTSKTASSATKAPAKKAAAKTTATKVKGTTKTKTATPAKKKTKKAAKPKAAAVAQLSDKPPRAPIHNGVLVSVVAVAVLYAAYEYRHDLSNRIHKLRSYRRVRAVAR